MDLTLKVKKGLLILIFFTILVFYTRINPVTPKIELNSDNNVLRGDSPGATTGKEFSGITIRKFPSSGFKKLSHVQADGTILGNKSISCSKWGVLTTVFPPSEAIRRQVRLIGWCLVIVTDHKTPENYETGWFRGQGNEHVVLLTVEEQENFTSSFIQSIPWDNFGRKNIGYLYAIQHGADVIWDFDDDNMLKFWIEGAAPPGAPSIESEVRNGIGEDDVTVRQLRGHSHPTYNPYPALGAPSSPSWPRGLPLKDIKESRCHNTSLEERTVRRSSVGVLQSLADLQPDVDAIYRLTMKIPFSFSRLKETRPLLIPHGVLTPFNAQATLHFKKAFWGLLLPVTVNGRVSDIWRSYIVGRLFWDCGLHLGFSARPLVVQNRNAHDNIRDLSAEDDLYQRSEKLVSFLGKWKGSTATLAGRIQELWIAMYERQYIDMNDVLLVQEWISNLLKMGYKFPKLVNEDFVVPEYPKITTTIESDQHGCRQTKSLRFWTADQHHGTRMDVPTILATHNHTVNLAGEKKSVKHKNVLDFDGISIYQKISPVTKDQYLTHTTNLTERMVRDNFEFYKGNEEIAKTDAFFCQFPASMCEMWMPFNKSIVFAPAHRYNLGRCTLADWNRLNEHLQMLTSSPHHVIGALSMYDKEYLVHYTGLDVMSLYSYSGYYTKHVQYSPDREEILQIGHYIQHMSSDKFKLVPRKYFQLHDLVRHRAIVLFVYSVMSYKLTEFYSMAIPLFIPSMKYFRTVKSFGGDRTSVSPPYCKNPKLDSQMTAHPDSIHMYSPNSDSDQEAEYYWLQLSDFYYWPHITHFDNMTDLEHKLENADFKSIHEKMVVEVKKKETFVSENWCKATKRIQSGRMVPQNYDEAILKLYNVSRLQVQ